MMKAVILYGKEDVRVEQIPVPRVGDGEVLVKIDAALTCGTDVKVYRRGYHARMIVAPSVFGHEFAGTITEVGPGIKGFREGLRVLAANSAPCGECFYCQKQDFTACNDLLFLNGAYAEYIKVPARIVEINLLPVPDFVPSMAAAMVEPVACVVRGLEESGVSEGDTVAIFGLGPIGLLFVRLAKWKGARVLAFGRRKTRLWMAERLGADAVFETDEMEEVLAKVRSLTQGRGADKVIECAGHPSAWEMALACARRGGTVTLFGGCASGTTVELDTNRVHYDQLTIKSPFHHTPRHVREAFRLIVEGVINPSDWISHEVPLNELPNVLANLSQTNGTLKVAIRPNGTR